MRGSRRRVRIVATLVGCALAVSGTVAVGVGIAQQDPAPPQPPQAVDSGGSPDSSARPAGQAGDARPSDDQADGQQADQQQADQQQADQQPDQPSTGRQADTLELDYAKPVRVSIPKLGVSSTLEDLGLDSESAMETPQDPAKAGWFTPGPAPGVHGASVISGHVTWNQEPAVFFELGRLKSGDRVEVARKDGVTAVFEVQRIGRFPKTAFPTEAVYSQIDHPGLRLITCGGVYDEESNRYLANIVVWAKMVSSHPTKT